MDDRKKHELWGKILKFCQEALKKEVADAAEKKKQVLSERIVPLPNLSGMSDDELRQLCREIHSKCDKVDEERYDLEIKVNKFDSEVKDLEIKIMDLRGSKFKKPPLRKVKMSTDQMLSALLGKQGGGKQDLRSGLKKVK
ncbi:Oidioi.mRNA.OKI2018_I69.chr2.g6078.t1.cds [Oikopleura dioica]|uniref:Oidioi.mRNA.OKI2018_I69.chr2.g6078.t1.cds n=1 Tax=Oikopleura dioica TaxID=34765 RepID=A0ABN7T8C1_OIKDI|nr:Oidioi.mRNA.OKI2018_I69.chr2.g6078.t1.cds [Oikopleura dioica]